MNRKKPGKVGENKSEVVSMILQIKDVIPETIEAALAAWDAGDGVFSVEMGGIGPGYEMSIQGLAFELLRAFNGKVPPIDRQWSDAEVLQLNKDMNAIASRLDGEPWAGFSGAQVGAAKSLVVKILRTGSYSAALRDPAFKDRLIQVCRKDLRR